MKIVVGVVVAALVLVVLWMTIVYIGLGDDANAMTGSVGAFTSPAPGPGRS